MDVEACKDRVFCGDGHLPTAQSIPSRLWSTLPNFAEEETDLWVSQHLSIDSINFGLFLLKSNARTLVFWERFQQSWKQKTSNEGAADQRVFDKLLRETPKNFGIS